MRGSLDDVADGADQAPVGRLEAGADDLVEREVRQLVQLAAGGQQLAALKGDGLVPRLREVDADEGPLVRAAGARGDAGEESLLRALWAQKEKLAETEVVGAARAGVQVQFAVESVDLAKDAAAPEAPSANRRSPR